MITLHNALLTVEISKHGAELHSLRSHDGTEHLWHADPKYWGRHAPILFPIVGSVWDKTFRIDGHTFAMNQHGFARDMDFEVLLHTDDHAVLQLRDSIETLAAFPFRFRLRIEYALCDKTLQVKWLVTNDNNTEMPYQIGAHPAFMYPDYEVGTEARGYLSFEVKAGSSLQRTPLCGAYADAPKRVALPLDEQGMLPLDSKTFDVLDTIILEDSQTQGVTLHDTSRRPVVTLRYPDMPVVGIWSPPQKNAPFICLEPWAGRADRVGFDGEFKDRDWAQCLAPYTSQAYSYEIILY